jgi:hypothetical protein
MNINQLIERLPEHPCDLMQNVFGREVSAESFYLYGIYNMHYNFYNSHVFIFNSINEFVEFLPAIIFNDIAINWDDDYEENNEEISYSEDYKLLENLRNQNWDELKCKKFIKEHCKFDDLELIEFGKLSDFMEVTTEEFNKSKELFFSLDKLDEIGITQCRYQLLHKFSSISQVLPSQNKKAFFKMIEEWDGN